MGIRRFICCNLFLKTLRFLKEKLLHSILKLNRSDATLFKIPNKYVLWLLADSNEDYVVLHLRRSDTS